jgi:hypothetical protein
MTKKKEGFFEEQEKIFLEKQKEVERGLWMTEQESKEVKDVINNFDKTYSGPDFTYGKGVAQQIENKEAPYGSVEGELTVEKLMSFLQDITARPNAPKPMILITGCIDQGIVYQSSEQFNLCNNPNCKNCRGLEDALKEQCK